MNSQKKIAAILVDIEGTTSSINFVHEVLFPYAQKNLNQFLSTQHQDPTVSKLIDECLKQERQTELEKIDVTNKIKQASDIFEKWIKEDKKIAVLKELQGLIWEAGYKQQDFYGHLYEDAYNNLKKWFAQEYKIYIYSSGSVWAQKLLFAHTKYGDLNYLFSGNFDTQIGNKKESSSYQQISSNIATPAQEILFLSDNSEELKAAQTAGLNVIKLARPTDDISVDPEFVNVSDFTEIDLENLNF
jgi:enolase-phosphatase E1